MRNDRSIPAPAGEPSAGTVGPQERRVYPRACGGTLLYLNYPIENPGLSPRLRGNPLRHVDIYIFTGSIPAPAGEPARCAAGSSSGSGLSPRLRGNPARGPPETAVRRSIPAPAGEPCCEWHNRTALWVYPRACGGTRPGADGHTKAGRSIPAPAGEPTGAVFVTGMASVYPRACGGTFNPAAASVDVAGLSPRLRGNQSELLPKRVQVRSIPAPAGEPGRTPMPQARIQVYPRACGGTSVILIGIMAGPGLSPRLRGNLPVVDVQDAVHGSIPAPAGEPVALAPLVPACLAPGVYPRACGGTALRGLPWACLRGLSPRLRGNHSFHAVVGQGFRSIPAPAGEPRPRPLRPAPGPVYPRACGGTSRT